MNETDTEVEAMQQPAMSYFNWIRRSTTQEACLKELARHYRLSGLIEVDDALVGGHRPGKRGWGTATKTAVLLVVERLGKAVGYLAAPGLSMGIKQAVGCEFAHHHSSGAEGRLRSAAWASLGEHRAHKSRTAPPELASQWLPKVRLIITYLKRFVLGTFRGVPGHSPALGKSTASLPSGDDRCAFSYSNSGCVQLRGNSKNGHHKKP